MTDDDLDYGDLLRVDMSDVIDDVGASTSLIGVGAICAALSRRGQMVLGNPDDDAQLLAVGMLATIISTRTHLRPAAKQYRDWLTAADEMCAIAHMAGDQALGGMWMLTTRMAAAAATIAVTAHTTEPAQHNTEDDTGWFNALREIAVWYTEEVLVLTSELPNTPEGLTDD